METASCQGKAGGIGRPSCCGGPLTSAGQALQSQILSFNMQLIRLIPIGAGSFKQGNFLPFETAKPTAHLSCSLKTLHIEVTNKDQDGSSNRPCGLEVTLGLNVHVWGREHLRNKVSQTKRLCLDLMQQFQTIGQRDPASLCPLCVPFCGRIPHTRVCVFTFPCERALMCLQMQTSGHLRS